MNIISIAKKSVLVFSLIAIISIVIPSIIFFVVIKRDNNMIIKTVDKMARDSFDRLMRYEVETVYTTVDKLYKLGATGQMEYEDAKRITKHLLREVRYELKDEIMGKRYFWADTSDGTNVVLYGKKDVDGKIEIFTGC